MSKNSCRIAGTPLTTVLDLGSQPLGNGFLDKEGFSEEYFFKLEVGFSETSKMLQLVEQPDPVKMFHDEYAFFSGTSASMSLHFMDFASFVLKSKFLEPSNAFVIELGCNDGIMLKNFAKKGIRHLGIEPSSNVAAEANRNGVKTISEFFTENLAEDIVKKHGQADAFLAANVMCHIPDIIDVVKGIRRILKPTGIVIFEDPYLGDVLTKTAYDQIYDEHVYIFSVLSVKYLFEQFGMELIDVQPQITHGGSMRYLLAHKGAYPINPSVEIQLLEEKRMGLDKLSTFLEFSLKVEKSRRDLLNLLTQLKSQGKKIAGYAATSKSTTILNYCGIGKDFIEFICDSTPIKQGKYSPGMHIPIVSTDFFRNNLPDYAFLFAWNHSVEVIEKEKSLITSGGSWITHVPKVRVI